MDTPGRRMTRSQMSTLNPSSAGKPLGRAVGSAKKKELRTPFTDLTNDSPVSGLMPAKLAASAGCVYESTPRSKLRPADRPIGEDLLRMQVTSLLRKVESEALLHQKKTLTATPDMFESPMRLAAPTPANTPAGGVPAQESKAAMLPPIVIASPICHLDTSSKFQQVSPPFVSTVELLHEETSTLENGVVGTQQVEQPTTRTLKFDSPERQLPAVEGISAVEVPTPASISTDEILSSIEIDETPANLDEVMDGHVQESTTRALQFDSPAKHALASEAQPGNRTLKFESPGKGVPDAEMVSELFSPSAHPHPRITATDEEDCWSVIVNVNSPEKLEGVESRLVDVPTTSEVDFETMNFIQNVLVDPEITARPGIPALWERRDTPARESGLKDDDDYEDCEEEYEEEYEDFGDEEGEETYEDGTDIFDDVCDELCKKISTINMGEGVSSGLPAFQGKHTRFNYNSDDEIEEDVVTDKRVDSPGKVRLVGLPTPKGKHIRFNDEAQSDQED